MGGQARNSSNRSTTSTNTSASVTGEHGIIRCLGFDSKQELDCCATSPDCKQGVENKTEDVPTGEGTVGMVPEGAWKE